MSTALTNMNDLPALTNTPDDAAIFAQFAMNLSYLPRIQLYTGRTKLVMSNKFKANHWGLIKKKDEITDLGETFVAVPLALRYRALDFRGEKVKSFFDPNSPGFKEVQAEAEKKLPQGQLSKCMAGVEYLLWIKDHGAAKSAKGVAGKLRGLSRTFVTFGSTFVDGKYAYQAPTVASSPVQFELPDNPTLRQLITEFNPVPGMAGPVETEPDTDGDTGPTAPPEGDDGRVR
jgi:hypothetical protein